MYFFLCNPMGTSLTLPPPSFGIHHLEPPTKIGQPRAEPNTTQQNWLLLSAASPKPYYQGGGGNLLELVQIHTSIPTSKLKYAEWRKWGKILGLKATSKPESSGQQGLR